MKILFIGDIVGSSGRTIVRSLLSQLKSEYEIDFVIANAENSAHGKGITAKIYSQLKHAGVDCITLGNHTFSKDDVMKIIDDKEVVRPANLIPTDYGSGVRVFNVKGKKIAVANLCGGVFMENIYCSPFDCAHKEDFLPKDIDFAIMDFHAEATSEKIAFAYEFSNQYAAVLGTHTHVQTADERLISGCAFISDVGMCGPYESVLGRDIEECLVRFNTQQKTKYTIAQGDAIFCGVVIEVDETTNKAVRIDRIQIRP